MFLDLLKHRQDSQKQMKTWNYNLSCESNNFPMALQISDNKCVKPNLPVRKKASPLDIQGMPDYEKLSDSEVFLG